MKTITLFLAVLLITAGISGCRSAQPALPIEEQVIALERAWSAAFLRHDADAISRILADDFVGIDGRGMVSDRAAEMQEARDVPQDATVPVLISEELSDIKVRRYADSAVLTAINAARFDSQGSESTIRYRRTTVWTRRAGRWQCVSFHGSRILE